MKIYVENIKCNSVIIIYVLAIYILMKGTNADSESYDENIEISVLKNEKKVKRCGPEPIASEESSGCRSSEETTVTIPPTETTTKKIVIPKGPFFNFLVNICNTLLNNFTPYRITKYFNVLSKSLRGLASGQLIKRLINKFCDKLKKLSDYSGKVLRTKVMKFLKILHEGNPEVNEFFFAMNRIYKIWDDNEMDDYIFLLRQYGQGRNIHIGQRTREIFQGLVFHRLYKQKEKTRADIEIKFKLAIIEYHDEIK